MLSMLGYNRTAHLRRAIKSVTRTRANGSRAEPNTAPLTGRRTGAIVCHMANYQSVTLDRAFVALSDPTRRAMLMRLEQERELTVSDLARPLPIKLPTVLKHLDVLSKAGLVHRQKQGRTVTVSLTPEPLEAASDWLKRYERFWTRSLDRLAEAAEAKEAAESSNP
jgi:DNA-binding transcriptional ArsR family regulator